jgi:acyl-coenzyme A thioesterase PaaI-like protein
VSFLQPATAVKLIAEGRVIHKGRSIVFTEGTLTTEGGAIVAMATATARIVPLRGGTPSEAPAS